MSSTEKLKNKLVSDLKPLNKRRYLKYTGLVWALFNLLYTVGIPFLKGDLPPVRLVAAALIISVTGAVLLHTAVNVMRFRLFNLLFFTVLAWPFIEVFRVGGPLFQERSLTCAMHVVLFAIPLFLPALFMLLKAGVQSYVKAVAAVFIVSFMSAYILINHLCGIKLPAHILSSHLLPLLPAVIMITVLISLGIYIQRFFLKNSV